MRIMTIFGTRPEIIRLSLTIKSLDHYCDHIIVHTGQNYDPNLSDVFFGELGVREPDKHLGIRTNAFGEQAGQIISGIDALLGQIQPDRVLILGDTNSALSAIPAARRGIPVFHMEAGNRCYDDRVPEEVNRRIVDHSSTVLLPYTYRSAENLVREGIERERIFVTGNPIFEVLENFSSRIEESDVLDRLGTQPGEYFLVTAHRAENVDIPKRLRAIFDSLTKAAETYQKRVFVSVHPRTRERLTDSSIGIDSAKVVLLDPLGFFDFVQLEKNAFCLITDSGTVQEECAIFNVPNVTIRDVTERPETLEAGSNIISGVEEEAVMRCIKIAVSRNPGWTPPAEYLASNVSEKVCRLLLGHLSLRRHF
ncbi:non-hydrolyzing UDP-N-acetylglucosamine 2-epimerase [Leptolyngbya sp. 7M]|uniref:non-hydrolyzing UDP-N-acetylglucosamine 2-epimerase n=1 Tax=Leptolyngbya sp. 7M TaxID=2812896 RepID=UPI001B8A8EEB|nr:UDP-N-acetylglucosamine 2-epimerase (non-hydrolyzing) [Leptolyngbya sp. 7M]QYO66186.1 UDP-N-acetylglucosamine 2-epimerase (non-hydrolyzing) [Leptolyngbya sp. 7M]